MKSTIKLLVVAAAFVIAPLLMGSARAQQRPPGHGSMMTEPWGMGPGMMGGGMMGGRMNNQPVSGDWGGKVLSYSQADAYIQYGNTHGIADRKTNTVSFDGTAVTIDLVAVQESFPAQTFELHGLINPTLDVPRGATVKFNLLNMDYGHNMEHTVLVSATPPPYPYMAMMSTGPSIVPAMRELPWRSDTKIQSAEYTASGTSFAANEPGTYWYICPTPEHAEKGMYGKLIIR